MQHFNSLSSDVKSLSLAKREGGSSMEPFELPWIHPCIVFQS